GEVVDDRPLTPPNRTSESPVDGPSNHTASQSYLSTKRRNIDTFRRHVELAYTSWSSARARAVASQLAPRPPTSRADSPPTPAPRQAPPAVAPPDAPRPAAGDGC